MRKIEYVSVFLCALSAGLCWIGNPLASFGFVASSTIGLIDSIKGKAVAPALINGIFLALNFGNSVQFLLSLKG